jgi:hypothetical protein
LVVAAPAWSTFSLIVTGTPCSGGSASPRATARSAWSASFSACADRSTVTALIAPFTACMRPTHDATASREEISRRAIASAIRAAVQRQIPSAMAHSTTTALPGRRHFATLTPV